MTRFVEGIFKLGFGLVGTYLVLKHWVGATNVMKAGARAGGTLFTSLAEPAIAARRLL